MNDSWRRATVGGPYGTTNTSPYKVVLPQGHDRINYTTSPTRLRMLEDEMLQRGQQPMHFTSNETDLLRIENNQLRRDVHELKGQHAATLAERQVLRRQIEDISLSKDCEASSGRHDRGVILEENRQLTDENNRMRNQLLLSRQDQGLLEQTVSELRSEIVQNNRTLVDQNETVRALTHEMSRRHPAQLVKYQREVHTDSATISDLTRRLSEATFERDRVFGDVKRVEAELKAHKEEAARAAAVFQQRLKDADMITSPSSRSKMFKEELYVATQQMRADYESEIARLQVENKQLRKGASETQDLITKVKQNHESEKAVLNAKVVDIKSQATEATVPIMVAIESCTNLLDVNPRDPNGTDPYVVLYSNMGKKVYTTDVIDNTLNPKFDVAKTTVTINVPAKSTMAALTAEVYHYVNKEQSILIGTAIIPVADILAKGNGSVTAKLSANKGAEPIVANNADRLGTLSLKITLPNVNGGNKRAAEPATAIEPKKPSAPVETQRPKPVGDQHVLIKVLSATNLISRDFTTSDPFVNISQRARIGVDPKLLKKTGHVSSDLNPKWVGPDAQAQAVVPPTGEGFIEFEVWDDDNLNANEFMGFCKVAVEEILKHDSKRYVMDLVPREKETDKTVLANAGKLGTLTVEITQLKADNKVDGQAPSAPVTSAVPVLTEAQKVKALRGGTREVMIYIEGCTDVLDRDGALLEDSDVYVVVVDPSGKEMFRTPVVESQNPKYEIEKATVTLPINPADTGVYTFEVWDEDPMMMRDFLGCVTIAPDVLVGGGSRKMSLALQPSTVHNDKFITQNTDKLGKIQLSITVTDPDERVPSQGQAASKGGNYDVTARILGCRSLLNRSSVTAADPFVMVYRNDSKIFSSVPASNTCDPTFANATVTFKVATGDLDGNARFEVWDKCALGNKFMGEIIIPTPDVIASFGGKVITYQLRPRQKENEDVIKKNAERLGQILLTFENSTTAPDNTDSTRQPSANQPAKVVQETPKQPRNVTFYIEGCDSLLDRDAIGGHSDPFVVVVATQNGKEVKLLKTPFINDQPNPKWDRKDSSFEFTAFPNDTTSLRVEVWDDDQMSSDFLGCVYLPITDVFNKTLTGKVVKKLGAREKESESYITENASKGGLGTITINIDDRSGPAAVRATSKVAEPDVPAVVRKVRLTIVEGKSLCNVEGMMATGESDPYVIVTASNGTVLLTTPAQESTLNPKWKNANIPLTVKSNDTGSLTFTVMDSNNKLSSDTFMGRASLAIADIALKGNISHTLKLLPSENAKENHSNFTKKSNDLGSITIEISEEDGTIGKGAEAAKDQIAEVSKAKAESKAKADSAPAPAPVVRNQYKIKAWVKNLKNIIAADFTSSDPFVKLLLDGKQIGKTSTVSSNLNPTWDEAKGSIRGIDVATNAGQTITLEVEDEDNVATNDKIGEFKLSVDDVIATIGQTRTFDLINNNTGKYGKKNPGTITLLFTYDDK